MPVNPAIFAKAGPSLNLNFLSGTLDSRLTFTRASSAWYYDSTGTLQSASSNIPRFDYGVAPGAAPLGLLLEEARTNGIRNNSMTGSVVGVPGTLPTNWTASQATGITPSVVAFGTDAGIPYIDVRIVGTTATGIVNDFIFESATAIAATQNQVWSSSLYCKLISGSLTNVSTVRHNVSAYNVSSVAVQTVQQIFTPTSASLISQRNTQAVTMTDATTTNVRSYVRVIFNTAPVAVDLTLRIGAPCLELGSFVTSPILTTNAAVIRAVDAASMPVGSWFNPAGHSALCVGMVPVLNTVAVSIPYEFDDGASARDMVYLSTSGIIGLFNSVGAVNLTVPGTLTANTVFKLAGGFGNSRQAGCFNGGAMVSSVASTLPTGLTTLRLGSNQGANQRYTGYVQSLTVWPRVLTDTELQKASR